MANYVSRRGILKLFAGAGAAVGAWAGGVFPEMAFAGTTSGKTGLGNLRVLSAGQVSVQLASLGGSDSVRRLAAYLEAQGYRPQTGSASGADVKAPPATSPVAATVTVVVLPFTRQVTGEDVVLEAIKKDGRVVKAFALRRTDANGFVRSEQFEPAASGAVTLVGTATLDRTSGVIQVHYPDGSVKQSSLQELQRATTTGPAPHVSGAVTPALADGYNCSTCIDACTLVAIFGCATVAALAGLLCGPAAPACAVLAAIIAAVWCGAVFWVGCKFLCCYYIQYCDPCYTCADPNYC